MNTVELGKRVRRLRKARDWSQLVLAEHAGIDRSTVARCEHAIGATAPETETLEGLAKALEVTVAYLTDGVGEAPEAPKPREDSGGFMQVPAAIVELLASGSLGHVELSEVRTLLDDKVFDPYEFEVQLWVRRLMASRDPAQRARLKQSLDQALDKQSAQQHEQTISVARRASASHIRKPPAPPMTNAPQPTTRRR